jgi:hypothetical protein
VVWNGHIWNIYNTTPFSYLGPGNRRPTEQPPSCIRLICSLSILIMLQWPQEQIDNLSSSPGPWIKLLADILSAGPYNLRRVTLHDVIFDTSKLPAIVKSCLDDQFDQFKDILVWNLNPLRLMRGVDLQIGTLKPFVPKSWASGARMMLEAEYPIRVWSPVHSKMKRTRLRLLESLAEEVAQAHALPRNECRQEISELCVSNCTDTEGSQTRANSMECNPPMTRLASQISEIRRI